MPVSVSFKMPSRIFEIELDVSQVPTIKIAALKMYSEYDNLNVGEIDLIY